jgi:hypothetical protein
MKAFVYGLMTLMVGLQVTSTFSEAKTIRTQSAIYSVGEARCDYTRRVRRACNGKRSCSFACTNQDTCGDPQKGVQKQCSITYTCTGNSVLRHGQSKERTSTKLQC